MKVFARSFLIFGSGLGIGACAIIFYRYWKRREAKSIDEGFEDVSKIEDNPEKRILVLGLKGAGKSTLISQFLSLASSINQHSDEKIRPTEGFNVSSIERGNYNLNFWEFGGGDNYRKYWSNFLQDTDVLVFVVDAAAPDLLLIAGQEVKNLLGDERLTNVPLLILANKQDLPEALPAEKIAIALDVASIRPSKHRVCVIGTQTRPSISNLSHGVKKNSHPSINEFERTLLSMV